MKLLLLIVSLTIGEALDCHQAWNGGGTGAWYRVDTSCQYAFVSTSLISCLPKIIPPLNETTNADGFYVNLGVFNRFNGASLDIGLTFDWNKNRWYSYANDDRGWKSGNIAIDSSNNPCLNVSVRLINDSIVYRIERENDSTLLGEDLYHASQLDPMINLTDNHSNIGFYRFDSIAQTHETLKSGSQMIYSFTKLWSFQLNSGQTVFADPIFIAQDVHGYSPGPCCTKEEIRSITVHPQIPWYQSNVSISYL